MAELLNAMGSPMVAEQTFGVFTPEPFNLARQDKKALEKIREEVMDKVRLWEKRQNAFFNEIQVYQDSWRVKPRTASSKKPTGLFNSKSGETHRATETLATIWLRMLTASDQYFEAVGEGFDDFGQEIPPEILYAVEKVLVKQLRWSRFKEKGLRSLRSLALLGTAIFEEPFFSDPKTGREYTDFVYRSLLQTGFDTSVFDIEMSDYIFTVEYPTKWRLRSWSNSGSEYWDKEEIEKVVNDSSQILKTSTNTYNRIMESKRRAGYTELDPDIFEYISYHGRLEPGNSAINALCEAEGIEDPSYCDFSVGILNGEPVVKLHPTQYGTWHSRFKISHFKLFENELMGYGVGKIGRKGQREQDITISRANDLLTFGLYSMWKVGRYAGLKANQLNIKPHALIELEDINQLERVGIDIAAIQQALAMVQMNREDFRTTVGAQSNLQGQIVKASATESAIAQNEGIRGASVHAEIIAETFLREHIETMHKNNLNYLDQQIWVAASGGGRPGFYDKNNLPKNIGFDIRVVTDKDFRPERAAGLLKGIELGTSVRSMMPAEINLNFIKSLVVEWYRTMGMNPRELNKPISVQEQLMYAMQKAAQQRGGAPVANEVEGEVAGEEAGSGANVENTPVGPVETSPLPASLVQGI